MKGLRILIPLLVYCSTSNFAQTDSLKNEFQFHLVPFFSNYGNEFTVQFGYARRFPKNHFLRTGLHIIPGLRQRYMKIDGLTDSHQPDDWAPGDPLVLNDEVGIGETFGQIFRGAAYIGYEHLFGKASTRFLLGVDLTAGIAYHEGSADIKNYDVVYTADTTTMQYNPYLTYTDSYTSNIDVVYFYFGISPRIGMRMDISRRIAMSIVYAPQFILDTKSPYFGFPSDYMNFTTLGVPFSLDLGLHVKL